MREQKAHLEERKWIFIGKMQFIPKLLGGWRIKEFGLELVPTVGGSSTFRTYTTGQYIQKM